MPVNYTMHRAFVWSGPLMMALMTIAFVLARILPPPSPAIPGPEVAALWAGNPWIRLGLVFGMMAAAFFVPFATEIACRVKQICRGDSGPAYLQLALGLAFALAIFFPMLVFMAAAFRPDRDVASFMVIYDIGWMLLVAPVSVGVLEMILLGWAILADTAERPIFPRWVGYYCIFEGIAFVGGAPIVFFMGGPFAWNGIFPFWLPFATFGAFFIIMIVYLLKAIKRDELEQAALGGTHEAISPPVPA